MQDSEIRQLDRDQRTRAFIAANVNFPDGSHGADLTAQLDARIKQVEQLASKQDAATLDGKEATQEKQAAIDTLLDRMRPISRTARSLDEQMSGFAEQFRMPPDSHQAIINRGRAFIEAATPSAALFTARGHAATFLTDLQTAVDAADAAEERQSTARAAQIEATANIEATLKILRDINRQLDAIICNLFADDPGKLASWRNASTIEAAPKHQPDEPPPPPPPPPTPVQ